MKLKLSKNQSTGMMGGGKLTIFAKVEPTSDEMDIIKKFKMDKEIVWQKPPTMGKGQFLGVKTMTVGSLIGGESYTCKDIVEMLGMEKMIIEAGTTLKTMVDEASKFGGETVIDL